MTTLLAAVALMALEPQASARVVLPGPSVRSGPVQYAIEITPKKGWHLYWKNPGDSGLPPSVKWELPEGWKAEELQFPAPERIVTGDQVSYGYEKKFGLIGALVPAQGAAGEFMIKGKLSWMACAESCVMGSTDLEMRVNVGGAAVDSNARDSYRSFSQEIPSRRFELRAAFGADEYILAGNLAAFKSAYFFCESEGIVAHATDQSLFFKDVLVALKLPKSEFATEPAKRLKGILTVTGPKGLEHYVVDTPVKSEDKS